MEGKNDARMRTVSFDIGTERRGSDTETVDIPANMKLN
jgi:hypothetical protein